MARLVMKFGGTSVADIDRIRNVARHVKREVDAGHEVAVVVSAMSGNDQPAGRLVQALRPRRCIDAREYDAVVASGEQVTAGLLAIALQDMGINARSWQGWQLPILTSDAHGSARILDVNGEEIVKRFQRAQGSRGHRRLPGHAQGDRPHHHARARRLRHFGGGGRGGDQGRPLRHLHRCRRRLHHRSARGAARAPAREDRVRGNAGAGFARRQGHAGALGRARHGARVRIFVRSSFDRPEDIDPHGTPPGTLICDEEEIMEQQIVTGIAFSKDEAQISVRQVQDKPGVAAAIFGPLADANINVDMIVQNVSADGATTDLTFTVPAADYRARARRAHQGQGRDRLSSGSTAPPTSPRCR